MCRAQTGFTRGVGTEFNAVRLIAKVRELKKLVKACKPLVVFIDFKAAFDSVNHRLLFEKLRRFEVDEDTIEKIRLLYSDAHTTCFER